MNLSRFVLGFTTISVSFQESVCKSTPGEGGVPPFNGLMGDVLLDGKILTPGLTTMGLHF